MTPLTPHHLRIPAAVARENARRAARLRLPLEEVESAGSEALVRAWRRFDPSVAPGAEAWRAMTEAERERALGGYLVQRVRWFVRNTLLYPRGSHGGHARRWAKVRSLDAPLPRQGRGKGEGVTLLDLLAAPAAPGPEGADFEEEVCRLTLPSPGDGLVLVWRFRDGLTLDDVAARLGVSGERVRQLSERGLERVRAALAAGGARGGALAEAAAEHARRTRAWPGLLAGESRVLAAFVGRPPLTSRQAAAALGVSEETVRAALPRLARAGYLECVRPAPPGKRGVQAAWRATPRAEGGAA